MKVYILDYGSGNIKSIFSAISKISNLEIEVMKRPFDYQKGSIFILPGVGAFPSAKKNLDESGLTDFIKNINIKDNKIIGICLGMQLYMESSSEIRLTEGLKLIKGKVTDKKMIKSTEKLPSIGWKMTKFLDFEDYYYFVHSFSVEEIPSEYILAEYKLGEQAIVAAIKKDNIYGFQFHPEKSGNSGLNLLKNVIEENI